MPPPGPRVRAEGAGAPGRVPSERRGKAGVAPRRNAHGESRSFREVGEKSNPNFLISVLKTPKIRLSTSKRSPISGALFPHRKEHVAFRWDTGTSSKSLDLGVFWLPLWIF